jgi:hypothetical protein
MAGTTMHKKTGWSQTSKEIKSFGGKKTEELRTQTGILKNLAAEIT